VMLMGDQQMGYAKSIWRQVLLPLPRHATSDRFMR